MLHRLKWRYILFVFLIAFLFREDYARSVGWQVRKLRFQGNTTFSSRELLGLMYLKPRNVFTKVKFSEWRMRSDLDALKRFYKNQGFLDNKITICSIDRDSAKERVNLVFQIYEGPRTTISSVKIRPLNTIIDTGILSRLSMKYGGYLVNTSIQTDIQRLSDSLSSKGYLDAVVKYSLEYDTAHYQAKVIYEIIPGPQIRVGEIQLDGIKKLKSKYVLRELKFKNGDILTSDKIHKSEQNLYRTNLLNAVQIEHTEKSDNENMLHNESYPVTVHVQETDFFKLQTGVGYRYFGSDYKYYEGLRAQLETSYSNLFALGHQISFTTDLSFPEQKSDITYSTPWFFGIPLQFASKFYLDRLVNKKLDSALIRGIELSLSYQTNSHLAYNLRFNYEDMAWFRGKNTDSIPKNLSKIVGTDIIYDSRNDIMDPVKGIYNLFSVDVAGLTDTNSNRYLKVTNDVSVYWKWKALSFGSGLKLGWIYSYDSKHREVPPQEQFSIGGTKILRGFSQSELHSSKGLLLSTNLIEMRFPIVWWFKGAVFIDAGNVYEYPSNVGIKHIVKDLRWSVGPGLRLKTPLAIVRMDVGFKLFRKSGESLYEFQFDIGQAF